MDEAFDLSKAKAELLSAGLLRGANSTRNTFTERCQIMACVLMGTRQAYIRKAFGVSAATVSFIAGCIRIGKKQSRYADVAHLVEAMGEDKFAHKFYTNELHEKLMRIKLDMPDPLDDQTPQGPNAKANSKSFESIGAFQLGHEYWRVEWRERDGVKGWYYTHCEPNGELGDDHYWQGMEAMAKEPGPFRTSQLALNSIEANTVDF